VHQFSQRFRPFLVILTVIAAMSLALLAWGESAATTIASTKTAALDLKKGRHTVHTVKIIEMNGRFAFSPATLTIKVGDSVVWTNTTIAPHTVTSDAGVFGTRGFLERNATFKFTFSRTGTFKYHCNVHPYMHATIIVKTSVSGGQSNSNGSSSSTPPSMPQPSSSGGGGY